MCFFVSLFLCLFRWFFVCLFVCLFVCSFVRLFDLIVLISICLFVCLCLVVLVSYVSCRALHVVSCVQVFFEWIGAKALGRVGSRMFLQQLSRNQNLGIDEG